MESLKMYIKDKSFIVAFYNVGFLASVFFIFISNVDLSSGDIEKIVFKGLIFIPFVPLAGWYFFSLAKDLIAVLLDYKRQKLVTATFTIKGIGYEPCFEKKNGAYFTIYFFDDKREFWIYRKSQIYSDFVRGEEYEITYYKNSRCIHTIKRLTFKFDDTETLKSRRKKKITKRQNNRKTVALEPFKVFISNYMDGFIVNIFWILTIPFCIILYDFLYKRNLIGIYEYLFRVSIPLMITFYVLIIKNVIKRIISYTYYKNGATERAVVTIETIPIAKKFLVTEKPNEFFVFAVDEKQKRKRYRFYSIDILGLGNLDERPGYMGYGNFLGSKYEIEYYRTSNVIKFMKILHEEQLNNHNPGIQSQSADGSNH